MPVVPFIPAIIGAAGAVGAAKISSDASKNAASASTAPQINVDNLNQQAQQIAQSNALASRDLENRLNPGVSQLRQTSLQNVNGMLNGDGNLGYLQQILQQRLGSNVNAPLLNAASAQAQHDLALGGQLPPDVANAVARAAAAKAGTVASGPGSGIALGRDINARDLGLTSLQLLQQRLGNASTIGGQQLGQNQFDANNFINLSGLLQSLQQNRFAQNLGAAQFGQSIQGPNVGLDPGSVASISVGNQNVQQAANANRANVSGAQAQGFMNLAGQGLGYALQNFNNYNQPSSGQVYNPAVPASFAPVTGFAPSTNLIPTT